MCKRKSQTRECEEMVNKNKIDNYSNTNEVQLKETKRTIKLQVDKNDLKLDQQLNQLNSIENTNHLLNDHQRQIQSNNPINEQQNKRSNRLNDDLKLYDSILSSYLANENQTNENLSNENQFLNCTSSLSSSNQTVITNLENELTTTNGVLIDDFENSIELNESDCDNNHLNNCTSLQNDPFLYFLPYNQFSTSTTNNLTTNKSNQQSTILSTNQMNQQQQQSSNLNKILSSNQLDKSTTELIKTIDLKCIDQTTLNNQTDLFQQFNNHNSPSDFMKLDQDSEQINKTTISSPIKSTPMNTSIDSMINEKRLLSSQKLNGEDLLFSLTSDDLNEVANYFPFLNTDFTKDKFNCSPSLDSLNSGDSMFCSSVFDSPSPSSNSSNNSSLNNDLDLPFILSNDSSDLSTNKQTNDQNFLDSEFPFLSDDSIFDSFVNSNLNDLINSDEFFNEKCNLNDDLQFENNFNGFFTNCSNFNLTDHSTLTKTRKPLCTLSKDSNLAKLLKEKLPIKLPSQSNTNNQTINKNQINNHQQQQQTNDYQMKIKTNETVSTNNSNVNKNTNFLTATATNNSTMIPNKDANDLKKNGLITREFTIQGLNMTNDDKTNALSNVSTSYLARSIKIIDPVDVQVSNGTVVNNVNSNVKYLISNLTSANGQTTNANSFSLNLTPTNCLTVTTQNGQSSSLTNSLNQLTTGTTNGQNLQNTTTKSFIIKSVDGKFTNGILYTPISRNGQTNIAYASNLTASNSLTTSQAATITTITNGQTVNNQTINNDNNTTKIMAFTPNSLFINNRKLVQKRPYSSMSVSISNNQNSSTTTKDTFSIDFVPKQSNTLNLSPTTDTFNSTDHLSLEMKKKIKTSNTMAQTTSSTTTKNFSSSKYSSSI